VPTSDLQSSEKVTPMAMIPGRTSTLIRHGEFEINVSQAALLPNPLESTSLGAPMRQTLTPEPVAESWSYYDPISDRPSARSRSSSKRLFDIACILASLPLTLPIAFIVALLVRLTSPGPILFLQERIGRGGKTFQILKFRTMCHLVDAEHSAVTPNGSRQITRVGLLLRKWKLDELPQLLNVLLGDMSLVGARPKVPEHQCGVLHSRPGITGGATLAFAHEGASFDRIPSHHLQDYYREVILPIKWRLDVEYMSRADFLSDLRLILKSVFRRWDHSFLQDKTGGGHPGVRAYQRNAMRCSIRQSNLIADNCSCIACRRCHRG
jgi:lipopolysaccharide/colanic/teichoic acid biosynthesis glycosyltransferase